MSNLGAVHYLCFDQKWIFRSPRHAAWETHLKHRKKHLEMLQRFQFNTNTIIQWEAELFMIQQIFAAWFFWRAIL